MPTLPVVAFDLPSGAADPVEVIAVTAGIMPNTCPFDITGHPATSVPAGLMIVGPRHADGLCLRVARAYEAATGGFPAPPGGA
jgi:amidase